MDGEEVLVCLKAGTYFGLNKTGSMVWNSLKTDGSLKTASAKLVSEYKIPMAVAEADVRRLYQELKKKKLIELFAL